MSDNPTIKGVKRMIEIHAKYEITNDFKQAKEVIKEVAKFWGRDVKFYLRIGSEWDVNVLTQVNKKISLEYIEGLENKHFEYLEYEWVDTKDTTIIIDARAGCIFIDAKSTHTTIKVVE
jgi:ribosomal protein L31E